MKNKLNEKKEEAKSDEKTVFTYSTQEPVELRFTGIYGDISEDKCSEAIYGMLALHETGRHVKKEDPEDEESKLIESFLPIDFYVSTYGGLATEMFSVYDTIRFLSDRTPIHTHGLGKVMSAGVLLLAAGTKGQRSIGKYCRIMLHGVVSGQQGYLQDVENEFRETRNTQKLYISALAEETNMDEKYIRKLMNKKTNVYFNAEEAVELGIADIIL